MSYPVLNMALDRTDGEWIITKHSDGKITAKLFGDTKGSRKEYLILEGRTKDKIDEYNGTHAYLDEN